MAAVRTHFADPHPLLRLRYGSKAKHLCHFCGSKLAGLIGYRCESCNFDVHEACADYFQKYISFFAHPWHALELSRMPIDCIGWECDLCREDCPPGSFLYRCVQCGFDVHPVCTMLPQVIHSSLHEKHDLRMVASWGNCSACREALHVWHYRCGLCVFSLHIACVTDGAGAEASGDDGAGADAATGVGAGTGGGVGADAASSAGDGADGGGGTAGAVAKLHIACVGAVGSGGDASPPGAGAGASCSVPTANQNIVAKPRRRRSSAIAKFILKQSVYVALNIATGGVVASPLVEVLSFALNN